jgi:hypothetical protein
VLVSDTLITFLDTPENGEDRFTVTVTNTGLEPLEVTGASIDLPFYCDFNGPINSGASAEMVVYFRPQNSGSFAATLTLDIVGTFAGDNSIEVNGAAYAPVASFNQGFEDSDGRMPVRWSGLISNGSPLHKVSVYNSASYAHNGSYSVELYNGTDRLDRHFSNFSRSHRIGCQSGRFLGPASRGKPRHSGFNCGAAL